MTYLSTDLNSLSSLHKYRQTVIFPDYSLVYAPDGLAVRQDCESIAVKDLGCACDF